MAQNKTLTDSLDTFGSTVKADGIDATGVMVALFNHALVSNITLNAKASKRAIKGHWGCKVQYRDKARTLTLAKHYEFVTSKLKGFDGETDGKAALDATIAAGLLARSRANFIGSPGAFEGDFSPKADAISADDVL